MPGVQSSHVIDKTSTESQSSGALVHCSDRELGSVVLGRPLV